MIEKPYTVTEYRILDRNATPPTVTPGAAPTQHKTEGAGRRAAKDRCDGGLNNGPQNLLVLEGPGLREVWRSGVSETHHGRSITIRAVPRMYTGKFAVVPPEPPAEVVGEVSDG